MFGEITSNQRRGTFLVFETEQRASGNILCKQQTGWFNIVFELKFLTQAGGYIISRPYLLYQQNSHIMLPYIRW